MLITDFQNVPTYKFRKSLLTFAVFLAFTILILQNI